MDSPVLSSTRWRPSPGGTGRRRRRQMLTAPGERRIVGGRRGRGASSRTGRAGTLRLGAAGDGRGVAGSGRSRWRDPSTAAGPASPAAPAGRPGSDRFRGQPQCHIAASNEGLVIGWPVRNAVLRLLGGMNLRLHPCSVAPAEGPAEVRATPPHPRERSSCNNASHVCRVPTVFRGGPLTFPNDGQTRAVEH